jgi:hypothetical protein
MFDRILMIVVHAIFGTWATILLVGVLVISITDSCKSQSHTFIDVTSDSVHIDIDNILDVKTTKGSRIIVETSFDCSPAARKAAVKMLNTRLEDGVIKQNRINKAYVNRLYIPESIYIINNKSKSYAKSN